ncbi:hypothetical protein OH76DRAFT_1236100 [Lentinus brumalis]|uniref:Uncharacterized protein n=1 Tax=Lentinus brumalis TaxID=2498619 RepID=A0A371CS92_9APHY|nr:hypothetical protein OH76DRAFT_1236100 [Polyporus brumalis]
MPAAPAACGTGRQRENQTSSATARPTALFSSIPLTAVHGSFQNTVWRVDIWITPMPSCPQYIATTRSNDELNYLTGSVRRPSAGDRRGSFDLARTFRVRCLQAAEPSQESEADERTIRNSPNQLAKPSASPEWKRPRMHADFNSPLPRPTLGSDWEHM